MNTTDIILAHEYFHPSSVGDGTQIAALFPIVLEFLSEKYSEDAIEGYNLLFLKDAQQAEEELVDDDWKKMVPEAYPLLYLHIQPKDHSDAAFADFLRDTGFVRVK